jgi:hypothetical protein
MWFCAITDLANPRYRGTITAVLTVPSVPIEKDEMRPCHAILDLIDSV